MATNNILRVNESIGASDQLTQGNYNGSATRTDGIPEGLADRLYQNKINSQLASVVVGIAESMAANQGTDVDDTLTPAQMQTVFEDSISEIAKFRIKASGNTSFYVDEANGSDIPGNGLASGASAWATINYAIDRIFNDWDGQGYVATLFIGAGSYSEQVRVEGNGVGWDYLILEWDRADPSNVQWDSNGEAVLLQFRQTYGEVRGIRFTGSPSNSGIRLINGAQLLIRDCDLYTTSGDGIRIETGSTATFLDSHRINGAKRSTVWAMRGFSYFRASSCTFTYSSSSFTHGNFVAYDGSMIDFDGGMTFAGSATGPRYLLREFSKVSLGVSSSFIPGNVAGSVDANSVYQN